MADTVTESVTYSSGAIGGPDLRFLHFNDVYHIDAGSRDPVGGASRFVTLANHYRSAPEYDGQPSLLTFFSGDAFNPSLESSVTKGRHMVPILNQIKTNVACLGNHDLDFGVDQLNYLAKRCDFPWLCANVEDPALGEGVSIGGLPKYVILESSNGFKVGVIGLVEREWLDTINSLPPNLKYTSASAMAKELVPKIREQGADIIVAVSHQREPNDVKVANNIPEGLIDIILGGHDHHYAHQIINGCHVIRSGCDFKQLSYIEARRKSADGSVPGWYFDIIRRNILKETPEDPPTVQLVDKLTSGLKAKLEKPIGYTAVPLDARFSTIRAKESNIANFVCDLMRFYYSADCTIMAAGTIRGDQIYPPGVLKLCDIVNCFPFEDPVVVIKVSGANIRKAIENGLSKLPAFEGRFTHVSNIFYTYDPSLPAGSRIVSCKIGEEDLVLDKGYSVATRGYMANGKDGYGALTKAAGAEDIIDEENGVLISMILRQYFLSLKVMGKWRRGGAFREFFGSLKSEKVEQGELLQSKEANKNEVDDDGDSGSDDDDEEMHGDGVHETDLPKEEKVSKLISKAGLKWARLAGVRENKGEESEFVVDWTRSIAPRLEGRIKAVEE
ncbi:Metallo-dependent phosphatase [Choiromyces venosus 120613-1]|uniref:Metallo-dependent phosphatase n=1 Tax=Choiromyces venosus 120613-1 TaxID=1336337 RepID=A0A3N4J3I5_9PEZI|nr:Metallo-dependent phosphatase [Choiromyces venosus 120613-1]